MAVHLILPYYQVLLSSVLLFIAVKFLRRAPKRQRPTKLPPGPWKLPIIGSLHHLRGPLPHHTFRELAKKHGPLMHLQLGEGGTVIVSTAEMAKEIMNTQAFLNRPETHSVKILTNGFKGIAFSPYGNYWRQLRKIAVVELLSAKSVESFKFIREEEVFSLVKSISASCNSKVNLSQRFHSLTSTIVARTAFGQKSQHQEKFLVWLEEATKLFAGFTIADLFPSLRLISVISGTERKLGDVRKMIDNILGDIIQEHRLGRKSLTENHEDLIDVLLRLQRDGELQVPMDDDTIKAVIQDMFSGGTDTSAILLAWAMSELVRNPTQMGIAKNEVREILKGKARITEENIRDLKYLKLVVKESLRLHPPAPFLLPRENREDEEVAGYFLPARTKVMINAWAIARDQKYWGDDAESFRPERFLDSEVDFKGSHFEFLPFGAGRRMCPGVAFGTASIELPLAQLLYYFDWQLPRGMKPEDLDMTEQFGLTTARKSDLCLCPVACNPVPAD